ncbi:MAG TPA: DsbC family protein [Casimicrobiaceae bacterium]
MQRFRWMAALAALMYVMGMPAFAQDTKADDTREVAALRKLLETRFPGAQIGLVAKSPYLELYEAQLDDRLIYTDAKAVYVFVGSIYDSVGHVNLTDLRMRELNRIDVATLPLDIALKKVKGDGSRKLYVFADADCPFCKRLESEMKGLDNVTIYTFLFPIDSLHPDSARKSARIWCAADRNKAWDEWFDSGKLPSNKGDCATPIAQTAALGQKYHVNATPTLVFADGSVIPGALPLAQLEGELKQAEAKAPKK